MEGVERGVESGVGLNDSHCISGLGGRSSTAGCTRGSLRFVGLSDDCPAAQLKINLHIAGVPEDRATAAVEAQSSRKRRRTDEDGASAADGA